MMSSTIRNKRVLILHEQQTDFIAIYLREEHDAEQVGNWVLSEMRNAVEFCLLKHVVFPDIRLTTTILSQRSYDTLEVQEFLVYAELLRN